MDIILKDTKWISFKCVKLPIEMFSPNFKKKYQTYPQHN